MAYFDAPYLTIEWDAVTACVVMTWKKFVIGENFRQGLNKGLQLITEQRASRWLADLCYLGVVSQEDQNWSNEDWFPRAIAGGILSMAIVVPENVIARWSVDSIMQHVTDTNLTIHYFNNITQAKEWLRSQ